MSKKPKELPRSLSFLPNVVASIIEGRYESALETLVKGIRSLPLYTESILPSDLDYAISAFENAVMYKISVHRQGGNQESGVEPETLPVATLPATSSEIYERLCNFCGKNEDDVKKLIAGWGGYICDGCVELCNEILRNVKE